MSFASARGRELAGAIMLLTRLPMPAFRGAQPSPAACVWAYPVVGAVVGAIGDVAFWLGRSIGLPPVLAAIWAIAATVLATGGLHEDGLADTADGFGGGHDRAKKLDIMRDSRIGTFGALVLMLSVSTRVASLAMLAGSHAAGFALICAGVAGRGAVLGALLTLAPARADGLAAPLGNAARVNLRCGIGIAVAVTLLSGGLSVALAAVGVAACLARLAHRQVGGYTGDVLGATEQIAECAALTAMVIQIA